MPGHWREAIAPDVDTQATLRLDLSMGCSTHDQRPCYLRCLDACDEMLQIAQRKNRTLADGDGDLPRSRLCPGRIMYGLRTSSFPGLQKPTQAIVDELEDKRRRNSLGRHRSITAHWSRSRATQSDTCISPPDSSLVHGCRAGTAHFYMYVDGHILNACAIPRLPKHPLWQTLTVAAPLVS